MRWEEDRYGWFLLLAGEWVGEVWREGAGDLEGSLAGPDGRVLTVSGEHRTVALAQRAVEVAAKAKGLTGRGKA